MPLHKEGGEALPGLDRRFVPRFATIAAPLTALTAKDQRNLVTWNDDCGQQPSNPSRPACALLHPADFSQQFLVQTDASAVGLGAVLAQGDPD